MLENLTSILQILAAIYLTLSIDKLFSEFVTRLEVRKELKEAIEHCVIDSDKHGEDISDLVKILCGAYLEKYQNLAPIYLFLPITLMLIISCDGLIEHKLLLDILGFFLGVIAFITFGVFAYNSRIFSRKIVTGIVVVLFLLIMSLLAVVRFYCIEYLSTLDYSCNLCRYGVSLFVLFSLFLPVGYFIYYSWKYPASCKKLIDARVELNNQYRLHNLIGSQNSENGVDINTVGLFSDENKLLTMEEMNELLENKGLHALSKEIKELKAGCKELRKTSTLLDRLKKSYKLKLL